MKLGVLIVLLPLLAQCKARAPDAQQSSATSDEPSADEPDSDVSDDEPTKEVKKYDSAQFAIVNVRAQVLRLDKSLRDSIEFELMGGKADYVNFELCPLEITNQDCVADEAKKVYCSQGGQCIPGIARDNRILFPPLYAGKASLKLTPCLLPEHAMTAERCGRSTEIMFDTHRPNDAILKLWNEKERVLDDLMFFEKQRYDAYGDFLEHAEICVKQHAKFEAQLRGKVVMIKQIRKLLPWNVIGSGLRAFWDNTFTHVPYLNVALDQIDAGMDEVGRQLGKACKPGGDIEKATNFVCTLGKQMKGMMAGMNPIHSLSTLAMTVFTLMDPEAQVARDCNAEDILHKTMGVIDDQVETKKAELQRSVEALRAVGLVQ